jgi:hypothetical protein
VALLIVKGTLPLGVVAEWFVWLVTRSQITFFSRFSPTEIKHNSAGVPRSRIIHSRWENIRNVLVKTAFEVLVGRTKSGAKMTKRGAEVQKSICRNIGQYRRRIRNVK